MSETNIEKDFYLVALGPTDIRVYESNPVRALQEAARYRDQNREVWNYGPWVSPRLLPAPAHWRKIRESLDKETVFINLRQERTVPPETPLHEITARDDARRTVIEATVASMGTHTEAVWDELRAHPLVNLIQILGEQTTELTVPDEWAMEEIAV